MTNESAGISYVVGAPERQGCGFRVWENLSNKQNALRTGTNISLLSTIPRDPITWEWKWNLITMLRRWLDTQIIFWEYDWMPMLSYDTSFWCSCIFSCHFSVPFFLRVFGTSPTVPMIHCNGQFQSEKLRWALFGPLRSKLLMDICHSCARLV